MQKQLPMDTPIYIFGEVLFDHFPDGSQILGGAPFNVAWHLQAFGLSPQLISRIGDDAEGQVIKDLMTDWGMSQVALQSDSQHPTGRVKIEFQDGEPCYEIIVDSAYDFIDAELIPEIGTQKVTQDKPQQATQSFLYHGSLALRNPIALKALNALKARHQGHIFMDVNLRAPWWNRETLFPLLHDATWVKLNEDELSELGSKASSLELAIQRFAEKFGLEGIIITLGEKGSIVYNKQEFISAQPSVKAQVIDTVGAGDAFASVFLLGLSQQWPIATTLERAQAFAAELVTRRGATIADAEFYRAFSQDWN
jgi:fructokinase